MNDRTLACRSCGALLPRREGDLVLKYFLSETLTGRTGAEPSSV
jgi:hypothetical protein